jgi:hypothetical protein
MRLQPQFTPSFAISFQQRKSDNSRFPEQAASIQSGQNRRTRNPRKVEPLAKTIRIVRRPENPVALIPKVAFHLRT